MRLNCPSFFLLTLCTTAATTLAERLMLPETPGIDLQDNPDCALPCLLASLNRSKCPTTNQTCLCQSNDFLEDVEDCVIASCPLKYALESQNITWTACHFPLHTGVTQARKVGRIVLFVMLPTLSIFIRVITKCARLAPVGPDDYTIVGAYVILVGYTSLHAYLERHGAGKDLWTLNHTQIFTYFKIFYALQTLYHLCIDLIKASILFSYLRIFHIPDEKIRIVLWATLVINLMSGLSFLFVTLFRCQPVSLAWTFWTGDSTGKCINLVSISISHAAINIALDLWMLTLPVTQIWSMNLARRKKFAVVAMFSLGLFLTIVSAVRISAILDFRKDPLNPTALDSETDHAPRLVAMLPIVVWSAIELNVGIFTACIPNIRQFFVRFILGHSDKKKRLASVMSGYARGSASAPKPQGPTHQFDSNELEPVDESNLSSPSCQKSMVNV
ncbi:hypothetical protein LX32DRAFT_684926 [Colletotrichum zoysiae]|uniref:CFEM domain-containing protein n=1 Tax=Colletotrichum zoysiae TaxID=1216348 RepID=A0AAD9M1H1_9PEZI|nr:hypothetical protein LX32DRAFT_684926 [Colletotrichum zoysiae]